MHVDSLSGVCGVKPQIDKTEEILEKIRLELAAMDWRACCRNFNPKIRKALRLVVRAERSTTGLRQTRKRRE